MGPRATAQHAHALRQHWSSIENHFTHKIILCKNIPFQDWAKHILNSCTEAVNPDSAPEYHQTSGSRQLNSVSLNILFHNFLWTMWTFFYDFPYCKDDSG
jgi:hypothetical protein